MNLDLLPTLIGIIVEYNSNTEEEREIRRRRPRIFRPRLLVNNLLEAEIHQQFRLNKPAILELYNKIKDHLDRKTHRSHALSGLTKLLAVLYFMATGIYQHCAASRFGISQPTFSRILKQVLDAMLGVVNDYIKFPTNPEEIQRYKEEFFKYAGMPNIIALLDCTHVALIPPAKRELVYRNRKMYRSINVQVAVGPYLNITDVVANFPGSCHDSYVLYNSELYHRFEHGDFGDSCILGDNGYRLSRWMLTPYLNPQTQPEHKYNYAHKRTRSMIERTFGLLKSRFRCLDITGGALLYDPQTTCQIIIACCMLHNIAMKYNLPEELAEDLREEFSTGYENAIRGDRAGQRLRQQITLDYFT